eukprot:1979792-Rhodomonas_salina.1
MHDSTSKTAHHSATAKHTLQVASSPTPQTSDDTVFSDEVLGHTRVFNTSYINFFKRVRSRMASNLLATVLFLLEGAINDATVKRRYPVSRPWISNEREE